jgi:hypothetical protein
MRPALFRLAVLLLVLALGIVIGAGPLQHSSNERDRQLAAARAQAARKQDRVDALESDRKFADAFAAATAPALVRGALAGRTIALVTLPGADPATVTRLRTFVGAAQGKIASQVDLAAVMAKSSSRQLVEALTSQMLTQAPDVTVAKDAAGYQRFGALLARAIAVSPGQPTKTAYDPTAVGIIAGLQSADLAKTPQAVSARAGLALVVAGPGAASDSAAADNAVPMAILQAFGAKVPTVVVGPTSAGGSRGVIGLLREHNPVVSTVDSAETTMGQVAGILALAARARGTVGQYGAVDAADGALPGAKPLS